MDWNNESANYQKVVLGLYIRVILGLYRENGKERGNYCLGFIGFNVDP